MDFKKKQFLFLSDNDVIASTHSTISYTVCLNKIIHPVDLVMHNIITLHTQLEQGKVIGTCVCMYNICVPKNFEWDFSCQLTFSNTSSMLQKWLCKSRISFWTPHSFCLYDDVIMVTTNRNGSAHFKKSHTFSVQSSLLLTTN